MQIMQQKAEGETAEKFFKLIQAGDLAFHDLIRFAIAVFGKTKVGKTTLCHSLNSNPMIGYKKQSDILYRKTTDKDENAKIGDSTDSQTQIPNQFTSNIIIDKLQQSTLQIIDTPGYGDSFGINRVLSNAFFHYRVYSKVQNMKFLIVFDSSQTKNQYEHFQLTMKYYFRTFKNYQQIQEQLLNSTAIVMTKVKWNQDETKEQHVQKRYYQILSSAVATLIKRNAFNNPKWLEQLQRFMTHMIKNKKIFIFRQAQDDKPAQNKQLLKKINQKTTFYKRQINKSKNIVDMSGINFSQTNQLISQTQIKDQTKNINAKRIIEQLKLKSIQTVTKIIQLLRIVEEQALQIINGQSNSNFQQIYQVMNKQNSNINLLLTEQTKLKYSFIVDKRYNGKRIDIKKQIKNKFKDFQLKNNQKSWTTSLKIVYNIFQFVTKHQDYQKLNFQYLASFKAQIQQIMMWISLLLNQKNKGLIHMYYYCIHRFFQEIYIMLLIANKEDSLYVDSENPILKIIDIFQAIPNKVNQEFINKMEANPNFQFAIHDMSNFIVDFLQKKGDLIRQSRLKELQIINFTNQFQLSQKCHIQIMLMKFSYIERQNLKFLSKQSQQRKIILANSLIQYVKQLKEKKPLMKFKDYEYVRDKFVQIEICAWNMLANIFLKHKFMQNQRNNIIQIFKMTLNSDQVLKLYELQIKQITAENNSTFVYSSKQRQNQQQQIDDYLIKKQVINQKIIQKKVQYAKYLASIGRSNKALEILQQSYGMIFKNHQQRKKVSQMIALIGLGKDKPISEGSQKYYSKLANQNLIGYPSKNINKFLQSWRVQYNGYGTILDYDYKDKVSLGSQSPRKLQSIESKQQKDSTNNPMLINLKK